VRVRQRVGGRAWWLPSAAPPARLCVPGLQRREPHDAVRGHGVVLKGLCIHQSRRLLCFALHTSLTFHTLRWRLPPLSRGPRASPAPPAHAVLPTLFLLPQEPLLFSCSILDNIRYGKPDATMEEVEAAARTANAHGFITSLPDSFHTQVWNVEWCFFACSQMRGR